MSIWSRSKKAGAEAETAEARSASKSAPAKPRTAKTPFAEWRGAWALGSAATLAFALTAGFIWRGVEAIRQDNAFLAEASPLLGDMAEMKALISSEALRLAYRPEHADTAAHAEMLRRIRARRFRVEERATALTALVSNPASYRRMDAAARLWWLPNGDGGAAAAIERLLEASAGIGRSLQADESTEAALAMVADRLNGTGAGSLGDVLSDQAEQGRQVAARLAGAQNAAIEQAGYMFLGSLTVYAALMMLVMLRPLAREELAVEDRAEPAFDLEPRAALDTSEIDAGGPADARQEPTVAMPTTAATADLPSASFEPAGQAATTLRALAPAARERGVDIALSIDPALAPQVEGPAAAIGDGLTALLRRALATAERGLALYVASREDLQGLRLVYKIRGASAEKLAPAANELATRLGGAATTREGAVVLEIAATRAEGAETPQAGRRTPLKAMDVLLVDTPNPAASAREVQLRSLGARADLAATIAEAEEALAAAAAVGRPQPLVVIRADDDAALTSAREAFGGKAHATLALGDPSSIEDALDACDPRDWAEALLDAALSPAQVPTGAPVDLAPRVLIVDDEAANRRILSLAFTRAGFTVEEATGGFEALEKAAARRFDLVTLDMRMEDIDGLETARQLRGLTAPSARAAVLMVTGEPHRIPKADAQALGISGVVAKPVNLAALLGLAKQAIGQDPAEKADAAETPDSAAQHAAA